MTRSATFIPLSLFLFSSLSHSLFLSLSLFNSYSLYNSISLSFYLSLCLSLYLSLSPVTKNDMTRASHSSFSISPFCSFTSVLSITPLSFSIPPLQRQFLRQPWVCGVRSSNWSPTKRQSGWVGAVLGPDAHSGQLC